MTHQFHHAGRVRTLTKHPKVLGQLRAGQITAEQARAMPWYIRLTVDGRPRWFRLPANTKEAISAARDLINGRSNAPLAFREFVTARSLRPAVATLGEYLALYRATATGESTAATRHRCALALERIAPDHATPLDQLGRALAEYRAKAAARIEAATDQAEALSLKRSFNSNLRQAVSVFADAALLALQDKLPLPDMAPFKRAARAHQFTLPAKDAEQFRPPPPAVLDATLQSWLDLPRDLFLAAGLALTFGLRAGEIEQVRWAWISTREGYTCLDNSFDPVNVKAGTARLLVKALNPFADLLLGRIEREHWSGDGLIIAGSGDSVRRGVSAWLRGLGWQTRLHLHALRAWAGSLVAQRYGFLAARDFCRHASVTTTEAHYGWLVNQFAVADPAQITVAGRPVCWHRAESAAFQPVILGAPAGA